jgi:hypothetical protein
MDTEQQEQVASHPNSLSNFMSKEELAEKLGVHISTLLRWHNLGIGPRRSKVGRVILYSRQEVDDFFNANAMVGTRDQQPPPQREQRPARNRRQSHRVR